ncbi:unnamed protein product [Hymenolepis diminuta]|uniref:Mos1 transposase HTH domain-containing protein n=1 Tax=Hymenolepis diminuta TaxID=6216 RepID=A0A564YEP1_HYMDI|nr:unnamed protein product [Hymenolepis diminuta]
MYTPNKEHIRHILLFESHHGNMASSAVKALKDTYASDVVNEKTCRRWFSLSRFKKDGSGLKDKPRAGCSKNSILNNCKLTLMKIQSAILGEAIYREIKRTGWESLKGWEVGPRRFVRNQQATASFLHRIITDSDKKWILYNNVKRKRLWVSQESGLKPNPLPNRKVNYTRNKFFCVWWDLKGIVYYELMGHNQSMTSEVAEVSN